MIRVTKESRLSTQEIVQHQFKKLEEKINQYVQEVSNEMSGVHKSNALIFSCLQLEGAELIRKNLKLIHSVFAEDYKNGLSKNLELNQRLIETIQKCHTKAPDPSLSDIELLVIKMREPIKKSVSNNFENDKHLNSYDKIHFESAVGIVKYYFKVLREKNDCTDEKLDKLMKKIEKMQREFTYLLKGRFNKTSKENFEKTGGFIPPFFIEELAIKINKYNTTIPDTFDAEMKRSEKTNSLLNQTDNYFESNQDEFHESKKKEIVNNIRELKAINEKLKTSISKKDSTIPTTLPLQTYTLVSAYNKISEIHTFEFVDCAFSIPSLFGKESHSLGERILSHSKRNEGSDLQDSLNCVQAEILITLVKDQLQGENYTRCSKILNLLENMDLETKNLPNQVNNLAHFLYGKAFHIQNEMFKNGTSSINPCDGKFQGEFGRFAFHGTFTKVDQTEELSSLFSSEQDNQMIQSITNEVRLGAVNQLTDALKDIWNK